MRMKEPSTDELLEKLLELTDRHSPTRESSLEYFEDAVEDVGSKKVRRLTRLAARAMLADPYEMVRMKAVEMLGFYGTVDDHSAIARYANDESWVVRASVYSALASLTGKRGKSLMIEGLKDRNPVVRSYAAVALTHVMGAEAAPHLEVALAHEKNRRARVGLVYGLAVAGDEQCLLELFEMAAD